MARYKKVEYDFKRFFGTLLLIIISVVSSIFLYDMYIKIDTDTYKNTGTRMATVSNTVQEKIIEPDITTILEETTESVVGISRMKNAGSSVFTQNGTADLGLGTGVIVSEGGYILTNWHVSGDKYANCYVTLSDGRTYTGNVLWADSDLDLSIVKIGRTGLPYISLGDSDNIKIGQSVYAIGNPIGFEFQRTVTYGIISAKNRTIKIEEDGDYSYMEDLIQTDATINPGNSGGPLVDTSGNMIGINTIKIISAEGIGFAVPINLVKPIINSFIETGTFNEAYIGIFGYDKEVIPYLDSNIELDKGIYVASITKDGPCYNSGLLVGDVITQIDNLEINKMTQLKSYIYTKQPNDTVNLKILRKNKPLNLQIKLGTR